MNDHSRRAVLRRWILMAAMLPEVAVAAQPVTAVTVPLTAAPAVSRVVADGTDIVIAWYGVNGATGYEVLRAPDPQQPQTTVVRLSSTPARLSRQAGGDGPAVLPDCRGRRGRQSHGERMASVRRADRRHDDDYGGCDRHVNARADHRDDRYWVAGFGHGRAVRGRYRGARTARSPGSGGRVVAARSSGAGRAARTARTTGTTGAAGASGAGWIRRQRSDVHGAECLLGHPRRCAGVSAALRG
jgi:hypothetical protein